MKTVTAILKLASKFGAKKDLRGFTTCVQVVKDDEQDTVNEIVIDIALMPLRG